LDPKYFSHREKLLNSIREHYEVFATIAPKKAASTQSGWAGFKMWLFSQPRDDDEKLIMDHLEKAKHLLDSLCTAAVDGCDSFESVVGERKEDYGESDSLDEDLETLAAYLAPGDKTKLCAIIGRGIVETEPQRFAKHC
jgi:hypothetical protein